MGGLAYSLVAGLRVTASLAGRVQGSRVHGWELRGPGISSHLYPIPRSADVAGTRSGSWGLGVSGAPSSSDWDKSTVFCLQKCVGSPYTGGSGRTVWPPRRPPLELPRLGSGEGSAQCINPLGTHIALPLCRSLARAWLTSCAAAHAVCAGRFLFLGAARSSRRWATAEWCQQCVGFLRLVTRASFLGLWRCDVKCFLALRWAAQR